eukprot:6469623-Amphidinium_carterae.2
MGGAGCTIFGDEGAPPGPIRIGALALMPLGSIASAVNSEAARVAAAASCLIHISARRPCSNLAPARTLAVVAVGLQALSRRCSSPARWTQRSVEPLAPVKGSELHTSGGPNCLHATSQSREKLEGH